MSDDKKQNKLSVHFPADEAEIRDSIDLVCAVVNKTPSEWAHDVLIKKLQDAGLLDENRKIIPEKRQSLLDNLTMGQRYVITEKAKKQKKTRKT